MAGFIDKLGLRLTSSVDLSYLWPTDFLIIGDAPCYTGAGDCWQIQVHCRITSCNGVYHRLVKASSLFNCGPFSWACRLVRKEERRWMKLWRRIIFCLILVLFVNRAAMIQGCAAGSNWRPFVECTFGCGTPAETKYYSQPIKPQVASTNSLITRGVLWFS